MSGSTYDEEREIVKRFFGRHKTSVMYQIENSERERERKGGGKEEEGNRKRVREGGECVFRTLFCNRLIMNTS